MTIGGLDCNGSDADTEWSDEGHHSDTSRHSGGSVRQLGRRLCHLPRAKPRHDKPPCSPHHSADEASTMSRHKYTVGHATVIMRPDHADLVLDNIDSQLYRLSKESHRSPPVTATQRELLARQGVEFDSADDDNGYNKPDTLAKLSRSKSPSGVTMTTSGPDEGDTGLGSVDDAASITDGDITPRQIIGQADVYSAAHSDSSDDEGHKPASYAEMDSDCAQQLDEKYKLIMKTKKDVCAQKQRDPRPLVAAAKPPHARPPKHSPGTPGGPPAPPTPAKRKKARGGQQRHLLTALHQTPSDIESVQTEDFENHFRTMMVKQVANVPITNFDQFMVDSDLDTVRSQVIRDKFLTALTNADKDKSFGGDSDVSTDTESVRLDALVEQKIQEILRKVKQNNAGEYSDRESVRAYHGPPPAFHHIQEESEEEDEDPVYTTRATRSTKVKRSARRSPNHLRRPPTVAYIDDMELGSEAREIERQSAKIRAEMEAEGWRSTSPSPQRSRTPTSGRPRRRSPPPRSPSAPPMLIGYDPRMSHSLQNLAVHVQGDIDPSLRLRDDLSKLQLEVIRSKQERQNVHHEVEKLNSTLQEHRNELQSAEKQIKESRKKAEDVRSEVMLAEFKRDSARKDLARVTDEVKRRRDELDMYMATATPGDGNHGDDTSDGNTTDGVYSRLKDLSVSKLEFAKLLSERESLQARLSTAEVVERERRELEAALSTAKDSALTEQRGAREREDTLRENLEVSESRVEELSRDRVALQTSVDALDARLAQTEADRDKRLSERRQECEELKTKMAEELARLRHEASRDGAELQQQVTAVTDSLARAESELAARDELATALREQLSSVQKQLSDESEQRAALKAESEERERELIAEKEKEVAQIQKYTEEEKNLALDNLSDELHQHNQRVLDQAEHRFTQELTDLQSKLAARELELEVNRDKLKQQEAMGKQLADKIRSEANMKFRQLVSEERGRWEADKEQDISRQLGELRAEMDNTTKQLRDELSAERQLVDNQLAQIMDLKKELEGARIQSRQVMRAKISALSQAKESAEQDRDRQMDKYRDRIDEESHRSLERLRDTVRRLEEESERLTRENKDLRAQNTANSTTSDTQERALLTDINDECRRVAAVLGTTPRVVTFTALNSWPTQNGKNKMPMKAAIGTALTNLKASNEDMRNHSKEMKQELDAVKQALRATEKSKKETVDALKQKMQKEKLQALETLKDRLIKEHLEEVDKLHKSLGKGKTMHKALREKDSELKEIQENMKKWKNQTTEKLATQFQEEMARELEKRLKEYKRQHKAWERERVTQQRHVDKLERQLASTHPVMDRLNLTAGRGSPLKAPPPPPEGETARCVREARGTAPRADTVPSLRRSRAMCSSTPDLQAALNNSVTNDKVQPKTSEHTVKQLELQLERAEHRAKLAEDRSSKNDSLLNQKLMEFSKLQGTLTQQTKELMQLERAYGQLQQKTSPVRPPSRAGLRQ